MKKPNKKRRSEQRRKKPSKTASATDAIPPYTTSLDAPIPGANMVAIHFEESSRRWIAVHRSIDGSIQIGYANTEALARTAAALKAHLHIEQQGGTIPASDRFVAIDHNSREFAQLLSKMDQLIEAVRENNEYAANDPEDRDRRLSELESGKGLLKHPGAASIAILASTITYLSIKFADSLIGKLADAALKLLEKVLGS